VRDRDGGPVERIAVVARLEHPARRGADRRLDMARAGTGLYAGTTDDVPAGAYDLVVEIRREDALMYRSRNRILLP
jgi:nitrogen fixation protein FixH